MPKNNNNNLEKDLKQLATMLKKKGNPDFKNQLRSQIQDKAKTMNEPSTKEKRERFNFGSLFKFGLIPATALVLVLLFSFNIFVPKNVLPVEFVNVAEAKDYYTLTALAESEAGIDADNEFLLKSKGSISAGEIQENLIISPDIAVEAKQRSDNEVIIRPAQDLKEGEVYSITLEAQNITDSPYKKEYSWAFQVSNQLAITSTIPGNQTSDVPTNSGIEIQFNTYGITAQEFQNNFSIEPSVNGTFSMDGKTGIFAPQELAKETVYTVTINENLTIPGSDKTLGQPYTFQFETSGSTAYLTSINFRKNINEFDPSREPVLEINFNNRGSSSAVSGSVYTIPNAENFEQIINEKFAGKPYWVQYREQNVDTNNLSEKFSFNDLPLEGNDYTKYLALPEVLPEGYYLIELRSNDEVVQSLIQVSNTAAFLNISPEKAFVWLHDNQNKNPIQGATVQVSNSDTTVSTDQNGFVELDELPIEQYDYQSQNSGENLIKVTPPNGFTTFYELRSWSSSYEERVWDYFQTDRSNYLPTDTVHYWAFIQGKNEPINGPAKLIVTPNYFFFDYAIATSDQIYYEQDVEIHDGQVLSGSFNIDRLPAQSYNITLVQNNETVSSTYFSVSPYTKPEYQITATPERKAIYRGGSTDINIETTFFEGTPVPNLELQTRNYVNPSQDEQIQTDIQGKASITYNDTTSSCEGEIYCSLFYTAYQAITPVREELADITGSTSIHIVRSSVGASEIETKADSIRVELQQVDLNKVAELPYVYGQADVWRGPAANASANILIEEIFHDRIETGQEYDPLTKTVQPQYRYETRFEEVAQENKTADNQGIIEFNPELDENKSYRVIYTIYDDENRFYKETAFIGQSYRYDDGFLQLVGGDEDEKFVPGDQIQLQVVDHNGEQLSGNNTFIYSVAYREVESNILSQDQTFDYTFKEEGIPNTSIKVYSYDGTRYRASYPRRFTFDYETRRLDITAQPNQASYEPGEDITLTVHVDDNGTPVANAYANIYLVDEAYYALFAEGFNDPLNTIYENSFSDFGQSYESLENAVATADGGMGGCFIAGTQILMADGSTKSIEDIQSGDAILTRAEARDGRLVAGKVVKTVEHDINEYLLINNHLGVTKEHIIFLNGQWQLAGKAKLGDTLLDQNGTPVVINSIETIHESRKVYNFEVENYHTYFADGIYVHNQKGGTRDVFKDTAIFEVVETDGNGNAQVTFELPDNITSWRASIAAIKGGTIKAGHTSISIPVTKPVFTVPVINPEYLEGDDPSIPVRAYGTGLTEDNDINFTLKVPSLNFEESSAGKAFVPSYITLPTLTLGDHRIEVTAKAGDNTDTIALTTNVSSTHLKESKIWNGVVTEGMTIPGSGDDRTELIFGNNEVGPIYGTLMSATYNTVRRADIAAADYVAQKLLAEYFDQESPVEAFDYTPYQTATSGISIVPYADSDLALTSLLLGLDETLWDDRAARQELTAIVESKDETLTRKLQAIYGLASVDAPRLTELNYLTANNELTTEDHIYAALAYIQFGAFTEATNHYLEIMKSSTSESPAQTPNILRIPAPTNAGLTPEAALDIGLEQTALTAFIASEIGDQNHQKLWNYILAEGHEHTETLILQEMMYAQSQLEKGLNAEVSLSINGENISLKGMELHQMSVTPEELAALTITNVQGEPFVISTYEQDLDLASAQQSQGLSLSRRYLVNGQETTNLQPGDDVEVHFTINIPTELEGSYEVKEYLPSGLKPTTQAYRPYFYEESETNYYHPYYQDGQEIRFYTYCSKEEPSSCTRDFYYLARVINKGTFVQEPAIIQKYDNPAIMGLSSSQKSSVQIQ
ncbi:MAG: polymorphic toxin-type HINT domain-containing protein [Candidatus Gracilibacteria bacterium]